MDSGREQMRMLAYSLRNDGRHHMANNRARGDAKHCRESRVGAHGRQKKQLHDSGGDALRGDTRSHPEHDG